MKHLGAYMDIHCGGVDNIFPHHTNEIAQSEAYLGHKWCNYWFHVHHLNDKKTGKMSKSNGDFLTVSLLESKGYDPIVYRLFCLQSHYRKPLEFSYEVLDNMSAAYDKLIKKIGTLDQNGTVDKERFDYYRENLSQHFVMTSILLWQLRFFMICLKMTCLMQPNMHWQKVLMRFFL